MKRKGREIRGFGKEEEKGKTGEERREERRGRKKTEKGRRRGVKKMI